VAFQSQLGLHLPTFHSEQNCLKVDMGKALKQQNFTQIVQEYKMFLQKKFHSTPVTDDRKI